MAAKTGNDGSNLSDINVTPLVDVMLVLLIIFMVTAPMMQQGIDVALPAAEAKALDTLKDELVITINRQKEVFINEHKFAVDELESKLAAIKKEKGTKEVYLRADTKVEYGVVVEVMAAVRKAGIEGMGMITEPGFNPGREESK